MKTVPKTMRAAVIEEFGGPEVLQVREVAVPELDDDEVLVALHTAGVGSWDPDMRSGWSPSGRPRFPLILGSDGSGTVVAKGTRVRRFKEGDRVYAYTFDNPKGGSYAQYVAVSADQVAALPDDLDLKQAGALAISGLTALQGLDGALRLRKGEDLIITGASGAVGTVAIQLAKARGAHVLAVASGKDGTALTRRLGADAAVDGKLAQTAGKPEGETDRTSDAVTAAAERFAPDGADALLALAGGSVVETCLAALAEDGRVAYPNGVEPAPKNKKDKKKERRGMASTTKIVAYNGEGGTRELGALNRAVEKAHLKVPIGATFPLDQVAEAHRKVGEHVLGKVILRLG